jgi:hypothetical protein
VIIHEAFEPLQKPIIKGMGDTLPGLDALELGGGRVAVEVNGISVMRIPARSSGYANAQLDDHRALSRNQFPWHAPTTMRLQARASRPSPLGTLGFGLWNDPFSLALGQAGAARKLPVTPQAAWFFYGSRPNDIALSPPNPGWGWKAQALTSPSIPGWILAAPAVAAYLASRLAFIRGPVMRLALGTLTSAELELQTPLDEWHTYELRWSSAGSAFMVDDVIVLETSVSPRGPLGFVTWIDNQYAVASPAGGLRFGVIPTENDQSLEIRDLELVPSGR